MIEGILGLPGDGKSYLGTEWMVEDLVQGVYFVATTVPLVLPSLREYVVSERKRRYGPKAQPFDLDENLLVMKKADASEFYRFRSGGLVLSESPDRKVIENRNMAAMRMPKEKLVEFLDSEFERMNEKPEYTRGVHYYIDEAHNVFNAREWATTGRSTLYYASQHRHLHDNIFLLTQVFENVEKQLRTLVAETHVCKNYINRSVGPFKMRPCMKVRSFYGCDPNRTAPYRIETKFLDIQGIGSCYETTGALGVHRVPEKGRQKGFLPWWSAWLMGGTLVLCLAAFLGMLPRIFMKRFTFGGKTPASTTAAVVSRVGGLEKKIAERAAAVDRPLIILASGISRGGDGVTEAAVPALGDWVQVIPLGKGWYRTGDGAFVRMETQVEKMQRRKKERDQREATGDEQASKK